MQPYNSFINIQIMRPYNSFINILDMRPYNSFINILGMRPYNSFINILGMRLYNSFGWIWGCFKSGEIWNERGWLRKKNWYVFLVLLQYSPLSNLHVGLTKGQKWGN